MSDIEDALETAVYAKLTGDATLQGLLATPASVFNTIVPEGSSAPYVVFQQQSAVDHATLAHGNAWEDYSILVQAITEGQGNDTSPVAAKQIRNRVDALLNDQALTLTTGTVMVCRRTSRTKFPELFDGLTVWHVGSVYKIGVSA